MSNGKQQRFASALEESRLAASLAHEINNPLDSVLNLLYLIKGEATLTDKGHRYLRLAEEEVRQASHITHAALHYFREFATPEETNIPKLVSSVIDVYRSRFEERGIAVNTRYSLGGDIFAYSGPLRQVFANLLLNAVAAMPQGGRLHARARRLREWSGKHRRGLRVTIADNGCGISTENLQNIFEPFFSTKGSGGSGLGLALVKDVVQRHSGSLRVRSSTKSGQSGSVFSIFLPDR